MPRSLPATSGSSWRRISVVAARRSRASCSTCSACCGGRAGRWTISSATFSGPILPELVERRRIGAERSARSSRSSRPLSTMRLLTWMVKSSKPIARIRSWITRAVSMSAAMELGADGVEIALHELAVAAALGVLAAPDGGDVVALERRAQLVDVLRGEAGQRHRQVETQPDPAAAVVLELVELLVGLFAPFAGQDFQIFQGRRVDGAEAVGAIDPPGGVDEPLAGNHHLRQIIAETFERAGNDALWIHDKQW